MIFIYTTCKNKKEASKIGEILVKERLAACINYFTIESIYFWQGKLQKNKETALLIKTTKRKFKAVEKKIKKVHSYEIPSIVGLPLSQGSKGYFNWLRKQIKR